MKFALLTETAKLPTRKNDFDAGIDLYLDNPDSFYRILYPNETLILHTGVTVEIPRGHFGWIANKSSKDYLIGGGIVDETYQGELLVKVINPTNKYFELKHGDAIAQLLISMILLTNEASTVTQYKSSSSAFFHLMYS